jgi:membrane associated rhomboid family serine protease
VIPIGDENRGRRRTPYVTRLLLLANIAVWFYEVYLNSQGAQELARFIFAWGVTPFEIWNRQDIPPLVDVPIYVTVFTSMFLHGGWLHIIGNMLFLWVFGDNIEDVMGHWRFLLFYLLAGVGAAALQIVLSTDSQTPMVGASGSISGVMAAYLALFPTGRVRVLVFLGFFVTVLALPAIIVIGFWIVLQFINGYAALGPTTAQTDGVAYFAHIGGFIAGLALVFLFRNEREHQRAKRARAGY